MSKKRKRHNPEQIIRKPRDADAMLNAGKNLAAVLQTLEVCEATYHHWRNQSRRAGSTGQHGVTVRLVSRRLAGIAQGKPCLEQFGRWNRPYFYWRQVAPTLSPATRIFLARGLGLWWADV
jgi:transposase-like protein